MQASEPQRGPTWQVWSEPISLTTARKRGKSFQHVALAVRGTLTARTEWMRFVESALQRTLLHVLGPEAPIELLVESALFEAATAWPPSQEDEPLSIWVQGIATGVARRYLASAAPSSDATSGSERAGGVREVLHSVYRHLRKLPTEEHLAFALLELDGRSLSEACAVLRAAPTLVRLRARRARCHLLFAARADRLLTRYICIAARLRKLARRMDPTRVAAFSRAEAGHVRPEVGVEAQWFV